MPIAVDVREAAAGKIESREFEAAGRLLAGALGRAPTASDAAFVASRFETIAPYLPMARTRLFLLRSFTIEPVVPFLRARCYAAGIDATVDVGSFNTYAQEFLDPDSALYRSDPHVAILAVRTADIVPELWDAYLDQSPEAVQATVERTIQAYAQWIAAFRRRSAGVLLLHTLELPVMAGGGVLGDQAVDGQPDAIERINRGIREAAAGHHGVHVVNYDALVARHGRVRWHDERRWHTIRMPLAADALDQLAREYVRFLHPITGRVCKVLALDLDNTLWAGIVGEDGPSGIRMGLEYPGAAHRALQRAALDLTRRGVMLAVCSRNNPDEALEILRGHPDMLLRPHHFAAMRIGWEDKGEALCALARELNIGLDAIAFFDDNPRERDCVRARVPDVHVIDVPDDPMEYADVLRACPLFERLVTSVEDLRRDQLVADGRQRSAVKARATSLEEFYRSLDMVAEVGRVDALTIDRVAQLTQKTNQFNLTTRRYSEAQIAATAADPAARVLWLRLRDRFGDAGVVGVAITRTVGAVTEIDTLLLSCRVIGRTVEEALLAAVAGEARAAGATRLVGTFIPTPKNAPARDFYRDHGFSPLERDGDETRWERDLTSAPVQPPVWITCRTVASYADHAQSHS